MDRQIFRKKLNHGPKRCWRCPSQAADGGKFQRSPELRYERMQFTLPAIGIDAAGEDVVAEGREFLRADAAGDALAARFVAKELHRVDRLLGHVAGFGVDDDSRAQRLRG